MNTATADATIDVRSFQIEVPEEELDDKGGHFPAWEEPDFSAEMRAAFSSLP